MKWRTSIYQQRPLQFFNWTANLINSIIIYVPLFSFPIAKCKWVRFQVMHGECLLTRPDSFLSCSTLSFSWLCSASAPPVTSRVFVRLLLRLLNTQGIGLALNKESSVISEAFAIWTPNRGRHWNAFLEDSRMFPETQACKLKVLQGQDWFTVCICQRLYQNILQYEL